MMNNNVKANVKGLVVDYVNREIKATKGFLKAAGNPTTDEFEVMAITLEKYPTFKVVETEIQKKENKVAYNGLTVERMLAYIHVFNKNDVAEFERCVCVYLNTETGKIEKGKYATIKKVFLNKYKDNYNQMSIDNIVSVDEKLKELHSTSNGNILNILTSKDNIISIDSQLKKAANE